MTVDKKISQDMPAKNLRSQITNFLETDSWEYFILGLIVLNAIILGLETSKNLSASTLDFLTALDQVILTIFVIEIALRIFAYRLKFWTDPWSIFDFTVVAVALIPATGNLSILRAFRILRALRLISSVGAMRNVVSGLLRALPGMGAITLLLLLICYVFSVMATTLYGDKFPVMFGSVGASAYTLFQIMTLDGWSSEIVRPVMNEYPWAWVYFLVFILVASFTVLNLFIGIIVEGLQAEHTHKQDQDAAKAKQELDLLLSEVRELRREISALKKD